MIQYSIYLDEEGRGFAFLDLNHLEKENISVDPFDQISGISNNTSSFIFQELTKFPWLCYHILIGTQY